MEESKTRHSLPKAVYDDLRKNPRISLPANQIISLLETFGMLSLLERDGLYELLLGRLAGYDKPENINYMEDELGLFVRLSVAYQTILKEFKKKLTPCNLPDYLDDLFWAYAKTNPLWQEGPGAYGSVFRGDTLVEQGGFPQESPRNPQPLGFYSNSAITPSEELLPLLADKGITFDLAAVGNTLEGLVQFSDAFNQAVRENAPITLHNIAHPAPGIKLTLQTDTVVASAPIRSSTALSSTTQPSPSGPFHLSVPPADVDPLDWIIQQVTEAWERGVDSIDLKGLQTLRPEVTSNAMKALQSQGKPKA